MKSESLHLFFNSPKAVLAWNRSCGLIGSVGQTVRMDVDQNGVVLSTLSQSNTSMVVAKFSREFFAEFEVSKPFQLGINARLLSILFNGKRSNINGNNVSVQMDLYRSTEITIEIITRRCVIKTYWLALMASVPENPHYDEAMRRKDAYLTDDTISEMQISTCILRDFFRVFPYRLEDFKFELDPAKQTVSFYGFNRNFTMKSKDTDSQITRLPMTLSIQVSCSDLAFLSHSHDSLFGLSFKLRDFRNTIGVMDRLANVKEATDPRGNVTIMFGAQGDPMVITKDFENHSLEVTLLTDSESLSTGLVKPVPRSVREHVSKRRKTAVDGNEGHDANDNDQVYWINDNYELDEELGPTQDVARAKGLFD